VDLLDPELRVRQPVGQLAVVGQEHQAGALLVEPADGVDTLGDLRQQVDDPGLARGVAIGRNVALGLVDGVIDAPLGVDLLAVDGDLLLVRVDAGAQLADDLVVDGDAALEDQLLARPPRPDPGVREDLLEPLGPLGEAQRPRAPGAAAAAGGAGVGRGGAGGAAVRALRAAPRGGPGAWGPPAGAGGRSRR